MCRILVLLMLCWVSSGGAVRKRPQKCEPITVPMCEDMEYKQTYMPNEFNHDSQSEAGMEVHQFYPLVEIKCSADLSFFLCSLYVPICLEEYDRPLPACRSVCERTKLGCEPIMTQYGFDWPNRMRCDQFPEHGDPVNLCMDPLLDNNRTDRPRKLDRADLPRKLGKPLQTPTPPLKTDWKQLPGVPSGSVSATPASGNPPPHPPHSPHPPHQGTDGTGDTKAVVGRQPDKASTVKTDPCDCQCVEPFHKLSESSTWYNKVHTGGVQNCAMNCRGPYFGADEHLFTEWWLRVWSVLCFISTFVTMVTFSLDVHRFQYPERPVIFLSACYLMVSIGYIIRLAAGHDAVACQGEIIRYKSTGPALCTVVFLLLYIFGMASSLWWVILSFTWFLSAGLKWAQEAIASYAQYFHLIAWAVPCIKAVTILLLSAVDGDPVSGVCFVGNQDPELLRWFVLLPLCLYLLLGTSFLVAGFISLFRIRNAIKQQGSQKTEKLERLMIRIGIFSLLYTLPATVVIACYFYEERFKRQWESAHTCPCQRSANDQPDFIIFMLKYFMCLVVGITSSCWVWSSKTVETWRKLCSKRSTPGGQQKIEAVRADEMYASISRPHPTAPSYPLSHV